MSELNNYFQDIAESKPLSVSEERRLVRLAQEGSEDAREKVLCSNLAFVVKIANRYKGCGIPITDLVSEGNLGLIKALDRFDLDKNVRFISYAVFWIKQSIMELISKQGKIMRIPLNVNVEMETIKKEGIKLGKNLQELSDGDFKSLSKKLDMKYHNMIHMLNFYYPFVSLDASYTVQGEERNDGANIVHDDLELLPENLMEKKELVEIMSNVIKKELNEEEHHIIISRYFNEEPQTLSEIGKHLNRSKERIRQIEEVAIRKMKNSEHLKHFKNLAIT